MTANPMPGHQEATARLERLKAMLQSDPANLKLRRQCIDLALQAGDYQFVHDQVGATLATSPGDRQAVFDRGSALIGQREFRSAIQVLSVLNDRQPPIPAAWVNLGLCHFCLSEHAEARTYLDAAYEAGDRSPGLLRLLIPTYHHLGLLDEAVAIADQNPHAIAADSALAGSCALLYLDADRPEPSERWAREALALNPNSVDALTSLATLHASKMETGEAKTMYERVLEIAPNTARAHIGLGTLAMLASDFVTAQSELTRGLELLPGHVGSWHVLGWTYLLTGKLAEAERVFQQALELDRNFAETHGALASLAAMKGDRAGAHRGIDVALRLDSHCLSAQFAQSVLFGQSGDPAAARRIIRKTVAGLSPKDGSTLARILQQVTEK